MRRAGFRSPRFKLSNVMNIFLSKVENDIEASHKLYCEYGEILFDWPDQIWITSIKVIEQNRGVARELLERLYQLGSGNTIHFGAIVAHKEAAIGFLRIQERFSKKYNVKVGNFIIGTEI